MLRDDISVLEPLRIPLSFNIWLEPDINPAGKLPIFVNSTWELPLTTPSGNSETTEPLTIPIESIYVCTSALLYLSKSDICDSVIVIWADEETKFGLFVISSKSTEPLDVK